MSFRHEKDKAYAGVLDTSKRILDAAVHKLFAEVVKTRTRCLDLELVAGLVEDGPVVVGTAVDQGLICGLQVWSREGDRHDGC